MRRALGLALAAVLLVPGVAGAQEPSEEWCSVWMASLRAYDHGTNFDEEHGSVTEQDIVMCRRITAAMMGSTEAAVIDETGLGKAMGLGPWQLEGDYDVAIGSARSDYPLCSVYVSFYHRNAKGKKKQHGDAFAGDLLHGLGESPHWDFRGRDYFMDVLTSESCGEWRVAVTPR